MLTLTPTTKEWFKLTAADILFPSLSASIPSVHRNSKKEGRKGKQREGKHYEKRRSKKDIQFLLQTNIFNIFCLLFVVSPFRASH